MKKCKSCGCVIPRGTPKVTITTGKLFRRKREVFHLNCFIADRKRAKT